MCVLSPFSHVDSLPPYGLESQAPLSMGSSRQEWSGLLWPSPRVKPASLMSPALAGRFFTTSATWETHLRKENMQELPVGSHGIL